MSEGNKSLFSQVEALKDVMEKLFGARFGAAYRIGVGIYGAMNGDSVGMEIWYMPTEGQKKTRKFEYEEMDDHYSVLSWLLDITQEEEAALDSILFEALKQFPDLAAEAEEHTLRQMRKFCIISRDAPPPDSRARPL